MTLDPSKTIRFAAGLALASHAVFASAVLRDPTEPPAAAQAETASSGPLGEEPSATLPRHIIVRNGRSYVVERGRRFGVGDTLGNARIERIDSDAVWLRDGAGSRRVPLYAGVTKRPAAESPPPVPAMGTAVRTERTHPKKKEAP